MCNQKFRKKRFVPKNKNYQICTTVLYIHHYDLWISYAFKVSSKSLSEIQYICPVMIHRSMLVKKFDLQITFMYTHFSLYANLPKCIVDTADIRKTRDVFISISSVNGLSKSNRRNSLSSLVSLWTILLQDIGTKCWLLLVAGTVFDFAKQSSR